MQKLTCPDGKSAEYHIDQLTTISTYLSFDQRCSIGSMIDNAESGSSLIMGENLASLDILNEIDQSVYVLKKLRGQIIGLDNGSLSKADNEAIKAIASTLVLILKNAQVLAKTGRVSVLQKGIMSYADTLAPEDRLTFITSMRKHISTDLSGEV